MDIKEMFRKMKTGEVQAHSELGTRDESKQTRNFGSRIQKMKTVTGINARALVMKDVVIKFNPFTGEADEIYNDKTPFRPIVLVSQVITQLKDACREDPAMNEFWLRDLGLDAWDEGPATMREYLAFKARDYIKPRIMTYSTVAMNFNGLRGFPEFKVKYTVNPTELNEEKSYDLKNAPVWHLATIFFSSMLREEAEKIKAELEAQGASKEVVQAQWSAVFSKSPVGRVTPTNLLPFLFFPLNEVPPTFDPKSPKELEKCMRYYSYTDKWIVPINEAMSNPMFDEDMDFFDFTVKTPSSTDVKRDGKVYTDEDANELYAAMQITNTDSRLSLHGGKTVVSSTDIRENDTLFLPVLQAAQRYFEYSQEQSTIENGDTFERIMAKSNRFRPIDTILDNFLPACNDIFCQSFANTPYNTEKLRQGHAKFFVMMNPANALALADADEDDLEKAQEEERESVQAMLKEMKEADQLLSSDPEALGIDGLSELDLED